MINLKKVHKQQVFDIYWDNKSVGVVSNNEDNNTTFLICHERSYIVYTFQHLLSEVVRYLNEFEDKQLSLPLNYFDLLNPNINLCDIGHMEIIDDETLNNLKLYLETYWSDGNNIAKAYNGIVDES